MNQVYVFAITDTDVFSRQFTFLSHSRDANQFLALFILMCFF